ncbi:MAG: ribose 5-phosphate isomerase B [Clostridia bacterium]|nr:ribose 5-phosphate isomerase B [Clostridia bacterium]
MIAIGSDHGGFELKNEIKKHLEQRGFEVKDFGAYSKDSVDYPDIAEAVCVPVSKGEFEFGVLVCGTGIGISIAANKIKGIRAAHVTDPYSSEKAKQHNNANIIALGGRITGTDLALKIVDAYVDAEFEGGRHQARVDKIMNLEG